MSESTPETTGDPASGGPQEGTPEVSPTAEQGTSAADGTDVTDGSSTASADAPAEEKPVWNVETHGALAEDDPRREQYTVVGE